MGDVPASFFCPITMEIMRDPVMVADEQTYERSSIEGWLQHHNTSPATNAELPHKNLTPNHALRNAIEEWQESYAMRVRRGDIELEQRPLATSPFKTVYKGKLRLQVQQGAARIVTVAVLKMRRGDSATEASMFLKLGRHPRLVRFLGQCIDGEEHLMLTEYAELGSLSKAFETWEGEITLGHELVMMQQVAQGMEHLIGHEIVHRDLAARNVLVFGFNRDDVLKTSVKISDYGLATSSYDRTHVTGPVGHLPVRYMSVEALEKHRFSHKSDVWAFGVLAWEILTLGKIPYYYHVSDDEVVRHVCGGGRLQREDIKGECPGACLCVSARA